MTNGPQPILVMLVKLLARQVAEEAAERTPMPAPMTNVIAASKAAPPSDVITTRSRRRR